MKDYEIPTKIDSDTALLNMALHIAIYCEHCPAKAKECLNIKNGTCECVERIIEYFGKENKDEN